MWDFKSFLCNQPTKGVPDANHSSLARKHETPKLKI